MLSGAPANGIVITHYAQRVPAASVLAGIATSRVHASLILLAISVNQTFGPAAWRDSEVTRQARTGGLIAEFTANAVGSAGGRLAGFRACYRDVKWQN